MRLLALLLLATSALGAAPRAGIEQEIAPPSSGPSTHSRYVGGIAYHGDEGFVVWSDGRMRSHRLAYGSRIDGNGQLLDPDGIRLFTHAQTDSRALGVVWTGDAFVVATTEANRIDVRRVRPDGTFDGTPLAIHSNDPDLSLTRRAWVMSIGSSVLVGWSTYVTDHAVLVRSDLSSATPIDIGTMRLTAAAQSERDYVLFLERFPAGAAAAAFRITPDGTATTKDLAHVVRAAVWTGRDYLIGYRATTDVFARLSGSLEPQQEVVPNIPLHSWEELALVAGRAEGEAIIVWSHGTGVDATVLRSDNSTDAPRRLVGQPASPDRPTLARSESGLILLRPWLEPVLLAESLQVRSAPGRTVLRTNAAQQQLAIARDGQPGPAVFIEDGARGRRVMVAPRLGAASRRLTDHAWEFAPAIASSPTTSLLAWTQGQGQEARVRATILDRDGAPINAEPITVGSAYWGWADPWQWDQGSPWSASVVWTGEMYVVAWITGNFTRDLVYQRVLANGTVLDPEPRTIPRRGPDHDEQSQPVMTRIGDETLLVWTEGRRFECNTVCTGRYATVRAMRLSSDGQIIDTNGLDVATSPISMRPDVAVAGDRALLVWTRDGIIYGRHLTGGSLSEPFAIARGNDAAVARHRDQFLVAVQDHGWIINGVMITKEGQLASTFLIATSTWQPEGPLAWTTPDGNAAVGYVRAGHHTGFVPQLFYRVMRDETPSRRRATRR